MSAARVIRQTHLECGGNCVGPNSSHGDSKESSNGEELLERSRVRSTQGQDGNGNQVDDHDILSTESIRDETSKDGSLKNDNSRRTRWNRGKGDNEVRNPELLKSEIGNERRTTERKSKVKVMEVVILVVATP